MNQVIILEIRRGFTLETGQQNHFCRRHQGEKIFLHSLMSHSLMSLVLSCSNFFLSLSANFHQKSKLQFSFIIHHLMMRNCWKLLHLRAFPSYYIIFIIWIFFFLIFLNWKLNYENLISASAKCVWALIILWN